MVGTISYNNINHPVIVEHDRQALLLQITPFFKHHKKANSANKQLSSSSASHS